MNDPIADMLTRIRNAQMVKAKFVNVPLSKFKLAILAVMKKNNYIHNYIVKKNLIVVELDYNDDKSAISSIKIKSKPGLRVYSNTKKIPRVMQGLGTIIISTSQGVMSGREAQKKNLGGEIICEIY